ncbi:MAG TPA: TonB-dependent receptor [Saprospiraceae bacterium]|nr:TonB-dependent receptor [Saprospiraceae bacterium]
MRYLYILLAALLSSTLLPAQTPHTQTIRGIVTDKITKTPLIGVNVLLLNTGDELNGTVTDYDGSYLLEKVPMGRRSIEFSYIGYNKISLDNIVVSSGREVVLNVEMEESVTELKTVEVAARRSGDTRNEMAPVSARQFSVEETDRYAGSRGDPARMASNFAGVQGADDSRNDIVIRGNSPQGVVWRFEGINIPNPNHFAIPGTTGGPLSIINNKYLDNSDFFTGAFPAQYGNGIAGVFDLRMRNGNNRRHELSAQFGILGTELSAEGPLSREAKSSYLLSYRYSTLRLFDFLGIRLGTDAVPQYQDGAFRFSWPFKNGGQLALWGIGGASRIVVVNSELEAPAENIDLYAESDRDQVTTSRMGVVGLTFSQPAGVSSFFKASLAVSNQRVSFEHEKIIRHIENERYVLDSLPRVMDARLGESKISANFGYHHKFNKKTNMVAGLNSDYWIFNYLDSARSILLFGPDVQVHPWRLRWDTRNQGALMLQPFVQMQHRLNERLSLSAGISSLWFGLNKNSFSPIEPRLGLSYEMPARQRLSFGYGLHSQTLPPYLYFYGKEMRNGDPQEHNLDLGLIKSHHLVAGYERFVGASTRLKVETYYQYLFNIPVRTTPSSFSIINAGSGFDRLFPDTLTNAGTARNYGMEATVERYFTKGYYFLFTGSLFDSKYRGSDNVLRHTSFNGRYAFNALIAKEFTFSKGSALNIGGKLTMAGGRRYGQVDKAASDAVQEIIYIDATVNTLQFKDYLRADLKLSYRWNRPKATHEFSIDIVNLTNRKNLLLLTYVPDHPSGNSIRETYQLGFLPLFYYKMELGW